LEKLNVSKRIFKLLDTNNKGYLQQNDFKSLLKVLLDSHPGLEFLKATPEFQDKYGYLK